MTRVALYARYSSDNQRDASIEDQLRICREKAEREKWTVVCTYKDAGISGASMILRPGIQTLLQDAQRQQFDVVLAEALDRISRDRADVESLRTPLLGKAEHLGARDQVTGAGLNRVSAL